MILATVDIDDVGTAKIKGFTNALDDLGNHLTAFHKVAADPSTRELGAQIAANAQATVQASRSVQAAHTGVAQAVVVSAQATTTATTSLQAHTQATQQVTVSAQASVVAQRTLAAASLAVAAAEKEAAAATQLRADAQKRATAAMEAVRVVRATPLPAQDPKAYDTDRAAVTAEAIAALKARQVAIDNETQSLGRLTSAQQVETAARQAATAASNTHTQATKTLSAANVQAAATTVQVTASTEKRTSAVVADVAAMRAGAQIAAQAIQQVHLLASAHVVASANQLDYARNVWATQTALLALAQSLASASEGTAGHAAALNNLKLAEASAAAATLELTAAEDKLAQANESVADSFAKSAPAMQGLSHGMQELTTRYRQQAQAAGDLFRASQPGITITKAHADAYKQLTRDMAFMGNQTPEIQKHVQALNATFKQGVVVTKEMHVALAGLAQAAHTSAQAFAQTGSSIASVQAPAEKSITSMFALAAAFTAASVALTSYLSYAIQVAARNEVLGTVMEVVGKNAGIMTGTMVGQIAATKSLGITTQAATEAVVDFAQANLNVADTSKLARVAQDLAVVAGKNSSEAFSTLTRVIQTQQVQMLRQYGITRTLGMVMTEYAREVGKTRQELTALDRQQAVLNLILKEGAQVTGAYEKSMDDAGKKAASLARYQEELGEAIGFMLLPLYEKWVDLQTALYKGAIDLPPVLHAIAAATMAIAAAMATLGAAILGGGIITAAISAFGAWSTGTAAAAAATTGLATATTGIVAIMGSAALPITAVVLAIAALAAGWVYLTSVEQAAIAALKKDREEVLKANTDLANLTSAVEAYNKQQWHTVEQTQKMRDMVKDLNAKVNDLAGGTRAAGYEFDEQTGRVIPNTKAIRDNTQAILANNRAKYGQQKDAQEEAYRKFKDLETQHKAAEDALKKIQSQAVTIAAPTWAWRDGAQTDVAELAKGRVAQLNKEMLAARKDAEDQWNDAEPMRALMPESRIKAFDVAVEKSLVAAKNTVGKPWDEIVKTINDKGDKAQKALITQYTELQARAREGAKLGDPTMIAEGADATRLINGIAEAYTDIAEEAEKAAKQASERAKKAFASARDGIIDSFNMNTPEIRGKLEGMKKVFTDAAAKGEAEYLRALGAYGDDLMKIGDTSRFAAEELQVVAEAARTFQSIRVKEWAEEEIGAIGKISLAVGETLQATTLKLSTDIANEAFASGQKRADAARASAEEIRQINEGIYEQEVVAFMHRDDQIRYAEAKRVADAQRALDERVRQRNAELDNDQRALDEKIRLSRLEVTNTIRTAKMNYEVRLEEYLATKTLTAASEQERIRESEKLRGQLRGILAGNLEAHKFFAEQQIAEDARLGQRTIDQNREALNTQTRDQQAALDKQTAAGARAVKAQIESYRALRQFVSTVFTAFASGAANAFKGLLTQTMSFKEAFMAIWNSILNGVSNIFNQIVESWISNAQRMATSSGGGFSAKGFMQGLAGETLTGWGQSAWKALGGGRGAIKNSAGTGSSLWQSAAGMAPTAAKTGAWASGTGLASTAMGGALLGGGVGGIVGGAVASRYADGSYVKGVVSGAASGAAAGGAVGGWWGAAGGAVVGGIAGYFQARKQRKQMEEDRKEIIENAGGIESLRLKAEEAGVSIDKMLKTKSVKEFQAEVNKLDAAFTKLEKDQLITAAGGAEAFRQAAKEAGSFDEATITAFINGTLGAERMSAVLEKVKKDLELKEAKDGLARTTSQMDALRQAAVLVGFDLKKLYDAKSIEEFNAQQAQLNKLLEAQARRLEGLNTAAQGFALRVQGLVGTYNRDLSEYVKSLSEDQQKAWKDLTDQVKEGGKSVVQQLRENSDLSTGLGGGSRAGDLQISGAQGEALAAILRKVEGQLANIGGAATATFAGILRETGSIAQAFNAIAEPLDVITELIAQTGAEVPEALNRLLSLRQAVKSNQDVADSLGGITQMLKGLSDAGQMTEGLFQSFGRDVAAQWDEMKKRGVAEDQALLIMQPTLQALWQAQKNFGFATDEATQSMIDLGVSQGLVGDQFQSINQKMLDMLVIIAEAVGGTVPEAYRRQGQAATDAAAQQQAAAEAATRAADEQAAAVGGVGDAAAEAAETARIQAEEAARATAGIGDAAQIAADVVRDSLGDATRWKVDGPDVQPILLSVEEAAAEAERIYAQMADALGISLEDVRAMFERTFHDAGFDQMKEGAEGLVTAHTAVSDAIRGANGELQTLDTTAMDALILQAQEAAREMERVRQETSYTDEQLAEMVGVPVEELKTRLGDVKASLSKEGVGGAADEAKVKLQLISEQKLDAVTGEADNVASAADAIARSVQAATDALLRMVEETRGPLAELEENVGAISFGRSPGGLKEIRIKAEDGAYAIGTMSKSVRAELGSLEDTANSYYMSVDALVKAIAASGDTVNPEGEFDAAVASLQGTGAGGRAERAAESALSPAQTIVVNAAPVRVHINSIDPSKARDVWEHHIRPEMEKDLDTNNRQLATRFGKALRREGGTIGARRR